MQEAMEGAGLRGGRRRWAADEEEAAAVVEEEAAAAGVGNLETRAGMVGGLDPPGRRRFQKGFDWRNLWSSCEFGEGGVEEKGGALRDAGAWVGFLREKGGWKGRSGNQRLVWTGPPGRRGCEGSLWRVSRRAQKTCLLPLPPTASTSQPRARGSGAGTVLEEVQTLVLSPG